MKLKFWIGIAISLFCLFFVFRGIEWAKVLEALRSANYVYLAIAALLNLSTIWIRAERWKYLLEPIKVLRFQRLVPATMIGFMANNVLPARAGEFVRAYLIGKKEHISKTAAFATIIIERVFDMATILVFLVVVLLMVKVPQVAGTTEQQSLSELFSPERMTQAGILSSVFVLGLLAFLVVLKEFPQQTTTIVRTILRPVPSALRQKVIDLLDSFRDGLHVLRTGMHLIYIIFWSVAVWLVGTCGGWLILFAFGLKLPFMSAMFILVLTAFAVALPSSPGYVGPFHAAVLAGILLFEPTFDRSTVAGISIIYHLTVIAPVIVGGMFYLWKEQLSLADIKHIEEEEQAEIHHTTPAV